MTATPPPLVRLARPEDAGPLARCQLACWAETYTGLVPQDRLDEAVAAVAERTERWRRILRDQDLHVAEHEAEVVGFASAGPSPDEDLAGGLQLHALYVRQARWGTGLGHQLLTAAVGAADASLWVLATNDRARRFYSAHGFAPDGRERVGSLFDRLEVRMVRAR